LPEGVPPQRTSSLCEPCCPLVQAGLRGASLSFRQLLIGIVQRVLHDDGLACGGVNQVFMGARDRETPPLGQSEALCQVDRIITGQGFVHDLGVGFPPGSNPIVSEPRRLCWLKRICDAGNDLFHTRSCAPRSTPVPFWATPPAWQLRPQARFTILYCSTDCVSRRGAAMKNLSHSASFHSKENTAPSNSGIKHLRYRKAAVDTGKPRFTSPVASFQQIA
jgi:hypothetical protein